MNKQNLRSKDLKKQEILKILEQLDLPMSQEVARANLDELSEDEMDELLKRYKAVSEYQGFVQAMSEEVDPEGYAKTEEEYRKEKLEVETQALDEEEREQAETDAQEEKNEKEETKKVQESFGAFEEVALDLEKAIQESEDDEAYEKKSSEVKTEKSGE